MNGNVFIKVTTNGFTCLLVSFNRKILHDYTHTHTHRGLKLTLALESMFVATGDTVHCSAAVMSKLMSASVKKNRK